MITNTHTKSKLIHDILNRSVDNIVDKKNLEKKLKSDKKLRVKFGIDPTSPNIHLGRAVPLLKLRSFQDLGHQIILLIGDFTGVIGDTSDKDSERPMLQKKTVQDNLKTYVDQFAKLVDIDKTEIRYNSEWLSKLTYEEICDQANIFSVNDFVSRINIKDRLTSGSRVSLREVLYPMMQGYDSVALKADVELGGSDQWFNLLAGRTMQKHYVQEPQDILTTPLIEGLDGRKMSSSWGNTINITDDPNNMFGKVMSMKDELIGDYFEHCTLVSLDKVEEHKKSLEDASRNPMEVKLVLAEEITSLYWGKAKAKEAKAHFDKVIRKKDLPDEIRKVRIAGNVDIISVLIETGLVDTKGKARRLVEQKGVEINGKKVIDFKHEVKDGDLIKKGKRFFVRVMF